MVIKTLDSELDPDPDPISKNAASGSALKNCGSETLSLMEIDVVQLFNFFSDVKSYLNGSTVQRCFASVVSLADLNGKKFDLNQQRNVRTETVNLHF